MRRVRRIADRVRAGGHGVEADGERGAQRHCEGGGHREPRHASLPVQAAPPSLQLLCGSGVALAGQRFRHEALTAGRLTHPNIVPIHQLGDHEGHPYIVTEYVHGKSMDRLIPHTVMELDGLAYYWFYRSLLLMGLAGVAAALDYAHSLASFMVTSNRPILR